MVINNQTIPSSAGSMVSWELEGRSPIRLHQDLSNAFSIRKGTHSNPSYRCTTARTSSVLSLIWKWARQRLLQRRRMGNTAPLDMQCRPRRSTRAPYPIRSRYAGGSSPHADSRRRRPPARSSIGRRDPRARWTRDRQKMRGADFLPP